MEPTTIVNIPLIMFITLICAATSIFAICTPVVGGWLRLGMFFTTVLWMSMICFESAYIADNQAHPKECVQRDIMKMPNIKLTDKDQAVMPRVPASANCDGIKGGQVWNDRLANPFGSPCRLMKILDVQGEFVQYNCVDEVTDPIVKGVKETIQCFKLNYSVWNGSRQYVIVKEETNNGL